MVYTVAHLKYPMQHQTKCYSISNFVTETDIIPARGAWIEFEEDNNGVIWVHVDRSRKMVGTIFLRALGLSTDELWAYYGVKLSKTGDMKRFPSPILFKPVRRETNWDIYVIWNELPAEIYTKTIIVNAKVDAASARRAVGGVGVPLSALASPLVELYIPDGLTVCGYMDYLFGKNASGNYHVNPVDYFMSGPGNVRNRIVAIYDELRKNYRP